MRLLTVAYNYPPIRGPESIQANRLIQYLESKGNIVDIVTRNIGVGKKYNNNIPEYGTAYRTNSLDNYLTKGIMRVLGFENYPDAEVLWYSFALKQAEQLLQSNKYDYIYTRSVPFTSHLIGLKLKEKYDMPWVAHFSDPWTDSPYICYRRKSARDKNEKWESKVINEADKLIFTSKETLDLILRKYNRNVYEKAFVLPHTYDVTLLNKVINEKNEKITFLYAGNFYGKRTPKDLFISLAKAINMNPFIKKYIKVLILGKMPAEYIKMITEFGIDSMVEYLGEIPYSECQRKIQKADVLVNIDAPGKNSVFLPSKVIEYIAYDKPIISIGPEEGTIARLLGSYGHINIANHKHDQLAELFCKIAETGVDWIKFDINAKTNFLPDTVASEFIKILGKKD